MIEITTWLNTFLQKINKTFPKRIWFVGLQGSYGRGEATETSDIDMVVILDEVTASDLQTYAAMLDTLPHRELLCGFLSGKNEIVHWEASDLFQLYYDTRPVQGSMDELLGLLDFNAVNRAIHLGACNIYHGCVHNILYDKSEEILKSLYKVASFVVQAICFVQTGQYVHRQKDLLKAVSADEQVIVSTFLSLKRGEKVHFQEQSELLFNWSKKWIVDGISEKGLPRI